jgi:hypothetical protein
MSLGLAVGATSTFNQVVADLTEVIRRPGAAC